MQLLLSNNKDVIVRLLVYKRLVPIDNMQG